MVAQTQEIMSKLEEIIIGWKNYVFPNKMIEEQAKDRLKVCLDCKLLSERYFCNVCHCFMPAKVRNPKSTCPKKLWN